MDDGISENDFNRLKEQLKLLSTSQKEEILNYLQNDYVPGKNVKVMLLTCNSDYQLPLSTDIGKAYLTKINEIDADKYRQQIINYIQEIYSGENFEVIQEYESFIFKFVPRTDPYLIEAVEDHIDMLNEQDDGGLYCYGYDEEYIRSIFNIQTVRIENGKQFTIKTHYLEDCPESIDYEEIIID